MSSLCIRLQDKLATASYDNITYNKYTVIISLRISLSPIQFVYFVLVLTSINSFLCFFSLQLCYHWKVIMLLSATIQRIPDGQ